MTRIDKAHTDWRAAALPVWWFIAGVPILLFAFFTYPIMAWLLLPVYVGGGLFCFLYPTTRKQEPMPKEFKIWLILNLLDKFCLGCAIATLSYTPLSTKHPNLYLLPLSPVLLPCICYG